MMYVYLFALLVGGGLLAFSFLGGHDDAGSLDAHHDNPIQYLSLRTLTYFLFVFGGVGASLSWTWHVATAPIVLLLSVASGALVGTASSALFGYLRKTDMGDRESEESFVGLTGKVTLPIRAGGKGKVLVRRGDRTYELIARPFDTNSETSTWKSVVVVEMQHGTALVSPIDEIAARSTS